MHAGALILIGHSRRVSGSRHSTGGIPSAGRFAASGDLHPQACHLDADSVQAGASRHEKRLAVLSETGVGRILGGFDRAEMHAFVAQHPDATRTARPQVTLCVHRQTVGYVLIFLARGVKEDASFAESLIVIH